MKNLTILVFALSILFSSCKKDETTPVDGSVNFTGNQVNVKGKSLSIIRLKNSSGTLYVESNVPRGELRIESSQSLNNALQVKSENGELVFDGNNLPSTINLKYFINPLDIQKIVVEGKNKVFIVSSPVINQLEIVTQGESELTFLGLKVNNLITRREGKSRMILSGEMPAIVTNRIFYINNTITMVGNTNLIYTENNIKYILRAPRIRLSNDTVYAERFGTESIRAFFLASTHNLRNEGESYLDALHLPTLSVTSKNEGKSKSNVWAINGLTVTGEGESEMRYFGNPQVTKTLNGSAKLIQE